MSPSSSIRASSASRSSRISGKVARNPSSSYERRAGFPALLPAHWQPYRAAQTANAYASIGIEFPKLFTITVQLLLANACELAGTAIDV